MHLPRFLRIALVSCLMPFLSEGVIASDEEEFEAFKRNRQQSFEQYRQAQVDAYARYRQAWQQALAAYREQLASDWQSDVALTDKTHWIAYSKDQKIRQTVDYANDQIVFEYLDASLDESTLRADAQARLTQLGAMQLNQAIADDPVTQAVDRQLEQSTQVETDVQMVPLDQQQQQQALQQLQQTTIKQDDEGVNKRVLVVQLDRGALSQRAEQFAPYVQQQSERWQIEQPLIYAVIQTESAFNPMARSPVPAFGLMQIVPVSAGRDVTRFTEGEARLLSADYLYDPANNVDVGTTYLHMLWHSYFAQVRDPQSRLYCVIAAYNTGMGNVARAVYGSKRLAPAINVINGMTPDALYERLQAQLPYDETRHYLARVIENREHYRLNASKSQP